MYYRTNVSLEVPKFIYNIFSELGFWNINHQRNIKVYAVRLMGEKSMIYDYELFGLYSSV